MASANQIVVVITFLALGLAPLSQKARVFLSYASVVGFLGLIIPSIVAGIDLPAELVFYSSFHSDWRNVAIHVVFVPTILWTAMVYFAYVPFPVLAPNKLFGQPLNFAHALAVVYIIFHVACDAALGSLAGLLWAAMACSATSFVRHHAGYAGDKKAVASGKAATSGSNKAAMLAGALHALSWYMQIHPGHAIFEGRKPALMDAMYQSFSVAPLFVFYEAAFALGYRPELAQAVHAGVASQHAAWARAGA